MIDNGCGVMKAGFAAEATPAIVFQNIIGKRVIFMIAGGGGPDVYISEEAFKRRSFLKILSPLKRGGKVEDWEDVEKLWFAEFSCHLTLISNLEGIIFSITNAEWHRFVLYLPTLTFDSFFFRCIRRRHPSL